MLLAEDAEFLQGYRLIADEQVVFQLEVGILFAITDVLYLMGTSNSTGSGESQSDW